ncbi:hypothetical protein [Bartonella saheliensis]|uniref:hypothetical protein n=1 Tax=Bartonella saheliensis TaxID=1457016 RepID=UPI001FE9982D|nr:hypothetical protein [Bartonella saheliensis]
MEIAILSTLSNPAPIYIGFSKNTIKNIHNNALSNAEKINISKNSVIKKGKAILLFANGKTVQIGLDAIAELKKI